MMVAYCHKSVFDLPSINQFQPLVGKLIVMREELDIPGTGTGTTDAFSPGRLRNKINHGDAE